jgi:hypothetical protein
MRHRKHWSRGLSAALASLSLAVLLLPVLSTDASTAIKTMPIF